MKKPLEIKRFANYLTSVGTNLTVNHTQIAGLTWPEGPASKFDS